MLTAPERDFTSISVICATLNCANDLSRLINSLREQTDTSFEFLVMDGGSTDGTWDLIASNRDIVTSAFSESDHGLYDALNKGIRLSSGEFYLVVGADDILHPTAIASFKQTIRASLADVIIAAVAVSSGGKIRRGFRRRNAWLGHAAMVTSHSVGMLFKKSLHDRFGYYSLRYPTVADGLFIKQVCTAADVNVVAADFVAGEFGVRGLSNRNLGQVLCESWQIQLDTGENPLIQFLLFQYRLLRFLPKLISRGAGRRNGR